MKHCMLQKALGGIKVLDLSEHISGPYCTKLLGMFGAEVIKVERPKEGDSARIVGPFLEDGKNRREQSALFLYLNTHKRSITLDIETEAGKKILKDLVGLADVLVESFLPGTMAHLGLGFDTLEKINPGLIMVSITDFGQTGTYRDFKGGRLVGYAMGGYMYVNGDSQREPLAGGGEQPAYQGGLNAYIAVIAALLARDITSKGDYIDISIMECMTSIHQYTLSRYTYSGKIQKRTGNRHLLTHPMTVYPCKDGYVSICAGTDDQTERMLIMMEMEHVLDDLRFNTGRKRLEHADGFDEAITPWFKERTRNEIVEACQEWRVPASYVNDIADLLNNSQYKARNFFTSLDHPEAGRLTYPRSPFRMSETPAHDDRAPLLGEHNEEIYLKWLGLTSQEFSQLVQEGVI